MFFFRSEDLGATMTGGSNGLRLFAAPYVNVVYDSNSGSGAILPLGFFSTSFI